MGNKINTKTFIEKAKGIHGDKYDYSLVDYKNTHTKVKIICQKHGVFEQTPSKHYYQNCPRCVGNVRNTIDEFVDKSKKVHGDKYDYSKVKYKNSDTRVIITCKEHGEFKQTPRHHLIGCGCPNCANNIKLTKSKFAEKSNFIHNNEYDYSLVDYKNAHTKVKIICQKHGAFEQSPMSHLKGSGCPICSGNKKLSVDEFIRNSISKHGEKYNYYLVKYINNSTPVKIKCKKHGIFEQLPFNHMKGCGCPRCDNFSIGEEKINKILKSKNIKYETQKTFQNCRNINQLPFDFYLTEKNLCIEFDGDQHFNRFRFEKDDDGLNIRKKRDEIKNIYCKENKIELIRIKYTDNIENKLNEILNDSKI
jgi:very-short-patch-repair endonuclease